MLDSLWMIRGGGFLILRAIYFRFIVNDTSYVFLLFIFEWVDSGRRGVRI